MNTTKPTELTTFILNILDDHKALEVTSLDVRELTSITDYMIVCSATSKRHAAGMASKLVENAKHAGFTVLGVEGEAESEWILIDLQDAVVHIMLPETRAFYSLEKLWSMTEKNREQYED